MKLDWHCVRAILEALEAADDAVTVLRPEQVRGWETEVVSYHVMLLDEAGYLEGRLLPGSAPPYCVARRLTLEGHELLGRVRSQPLWDEIKRMSRERGVELTFELAKQVSSIAIARLFGAKGGS